MREAETAPTAERKSPTLKTLIRIAQRALTGRRRRDLEVPEAPPVTRETGSFTHGICTECDWTGPARRARGVAAEDADLHRLAGCGIDVPVPVGQCHDDSVHHVG